MADEKQLSLQLVDDKMLKDFLLGSNTKISDAQYIIFSGIARSFQLNPFKREIYCIPYERSVRNGDKWEKVTEISIVTGYQVYIERAMKSGMLDGWKEPEVIRDNKGIITGAKITIHRKDWSFPFEWTVNWKEVAKLNRDGQPMSSWASQPEFMIKKVAIGQGFRLAFPSELGGMPYLAEEEKFVQDGEEVKPVEAKEDVLVEIEKKFMERVGDLFVNPDPAKAEESKRTITLVFKELKEEFKIVNKSPEHEAMISIYNRSLALLTPTPTTNEGTNDSEVHGSSEPA